MGAVLGPLPSFCSHPWRPLGSCCLTSLAVGPFLMLPSLAGHRASRRPLFAVIFTMKSPLAVFVKVTWRGASEFRGRNS